MKQTEIGLIPDDWEVKEIKDFADVTTGDKNTQDAEENGKYPFYVRSPIVERINKFSYDTEGVITAGDGVGTGKVFHYAKGKFGLHQRAYLIYNFKNTDPKYFYYNFSKNFYERVHSMTAKSSVDSVRREMITKMQIPIPPTLAEQQRIAKALSDVDALISTTEKLIQKKKNIKQGTMQNLLTGKKRLPGFGPQTKSPAYKQTELGLIPEDWEVMSLGEFCQIKDGTHGTYARVENGYLLLSAKNILNGKLDIQESESLISENAYKEIVKNGFPKKKDLLISCVGTIGRCCIFDTYEEIAFQRSVAFIRQNQIDNLFLMYFIQSDLFQKQLREAVNASTLGGVYLGAFNPLQISFSSDKKEQTAIANVLSSMDKEIETLNTKLEKYRNLKIAMMQQLLTGKIRLIK